MAAEPGAADDEPLSTPDGRYIVVRGRLWRKSDPRLAGEQRQRLVEELMRARRAVHEARRGHEAAAESDAHEAVQRAKVALGERGPVWWDDEAPDLTRRLARTTCYRDWYASIAGAE